MYLQCHTLRQVAVGAIVGSVTGTLWYTIYTNVSGQCASLRHFSVTSSERKHRLGMPILQGYVAIVRRCRTTFSFVLCPQYVYDRFAVELCVGPDIARLLWIVIVLYCLLLASGCDTSLRHTVPSGGMLYESGK